MHANDLLLEVIGQVETERVQHAIGHAFQVSVWPYARLGDATLRLHPLEPQAPSDAELIERIQRAGLTVLGARHVPNAA